MHDLDLTSLRLFVAICEHGSMTRVAEGASLAASAISKRMAQLEHVTRATLLTRVKNGMAPTAAGESLLGHARALLAQADLLERDLLGFSAPARELVRVLAATTAIAESLPDHLAAFLTRPENDGVQVHVDERDSNDVVRQVREGSASLGICWDLVDTQGLATRPYSSDEMCIVTPPGHALARQRRIRFERALVFDFVGMPFTNSFQALLRRVARSGNGNMRYRLVVPTFDAVAAAVARGAGIGLMPREVARRQALGQALAIVGLSDPWAVRRFVICHRQDRPVSRATRALGDHLAGFAAPRRPLA